MAEKLLNLLNALAESGDKLSAVEDVHIYLNGTSILNNTDSIFTKGEHLSYLFDCLGEGQKDRFVSSIMMIICFIC